MVFFTLDETKDLEGKRRLAGLFLPFLLDRCVACMKTYLADAAIRGKMPFQRCAPSDHLEEQTLTAIAE